MYIVKIYQTYQLTGWFCSININLNISKACCKRERGLLLLNVFHRLIMYSVGIPLIDGNPLGETLKLKWFWASIKNLSRS